MLFSEMHVGDRRCGNKIMNPKKSSVESKWIVTVNCRPDPAIKPSAESTYSDIRACSKKERSIDKSTQSNVAKCPRGLQMSSTCIS